MGVVAITTHHAPLTALSQLHHGKKTQHNGASQGRVMVREVSEIPVRPCYVLVHRKRTLERMNVRLLVFPPCLGFSLGHVLKVQPHGSANRSRGSDERTSVTRVS
jgi:hypothetical protein